MWRAHGDKPWEKAQPAAGRGLRGCGAGVDGAVFNPPWVLKTQEAEQQENPGPRALLGAGVWGKMVAPSGGAPSHHLSQAAGHGLEASGSVLSLGDEFGAHTVVEMCWGIAPVIASGVAADVR